MAERIHELVGYLDGSPNLYYSATTESLTVGPSHSTPLSLHPRFRRRGQRATPYPVASTSQASPSISPVPQARRASPSRSPMASTSEAPPSTRAVPQAPRATAARTLFPPRLNPLPSIRIEPPQNSLMVS